MEEQIQDWYRYKEYLTSAKISDNAVFLPMDDFITFYTRMKDRIDYSEIIGRVIQTFFILESSYNNYNIFNEAQKLLKSYALSLQQKYGCILPKFDMDFYRKNVRQYIDNRIVNDFDDFLQEYADLTQGMINFDNIRMLLASTIRKFNYRTGVEFVKILQQYVNICYDEWYAQRHHIGI